MSDEPQRKTRRKMERIFICNDIWWHCLPFLSRAKVGLAFALVSDRFDRVSDRHLGSKKRPWTLCKLIIKRERDDAIIFNYDTEKYLPLPEEPLPENVVGFKRITICYIDHKVINFLHRIRLLFQPKNNGDGGIGFDFRVCASQMRSWHVFFDSIWPLIDQSAITKLNFARNSFDTFRQRFSPTFLTDLANVRLVDGRWGIGFDNEPNGQLLWQWLHTPRADGKPKLLKNYCFGGFQETVDRLKTTFLNGKTAFSYIIDMQCSGADADAVPFELDNLHTGERLTFRHVDGTDFWLLERGPIGGRDAAQWAKWGREVMGEEKTHNLLTLLHDDTLIGSLDEPAGPSGQ